MTPESNRVFTVGMEWRGRRGEKGREAPIAWTQNLEPSRRQDFPAATYLCQKVRFGTPETEAVRGTMKQSGEQEEPLFMALIVRENLPLSTHRGPTCDSRRRREGLPVNPNCSLLG